MGEPGEIRWRRRGHKPRRVVLLIDVSGSMSAYADALLRLAHRMTQAGPVETFTIGTRLTHVTRALRGRDAERALVAAGETVPDWSGGTRLGETLQMFLERWGRRGLARGCRRRRVQRRVGARRRRRCSPSRCGACDGSRTGSCG